jgi:hypothetical protein
VKSGNNLSESLYKVEGFPPPLKVIGRASLSDRKGELEESELEELSELEENSLVLEPT